MVLRESPLMEVRNEGGDPLKSQWMLFFMTVREHGPPRSRWRAPHVAHASAHADQVGSFGAEQLS